MPGIRRAAMSLPPPPDGYSARMPRFEEGPALCPVGLDALGREVQLAPAAREAWLAMRTAAAHAGVRLLLLSGFRSVERQGQIVASKLERGIPLEKILLTNAYPGFSEHHTGCAVDIGSDACEHLTEAFERTGEFRWLLSRGAAFGFRLSYPRGNACGIAYEPWHWRWHPS